MSENEIVNATPESEQAEEKQERTPFDQFLYHQRRAMEEVSKAINALLPEGFKTHGAEAHKEFQSGMKVLLEAAIAEVEKIARRAEKAAEEGGEEGEERPSTTGKVKVKVQVE
ncbi:MAG: hypothetical protein HXY40_13250 [Chloroflexi bacterium]|nr:hypothetical protein [Chloroflexota bacterium]